MNHVAEIEPVEYEPVRIRVLPDGSVDSRNAGKYLNRAVKTLAMWRLQGTGPRYRKVNGRVRYDLADLERYDAG